MNKDEIQAVQEAGFNDLDHLLETVRDLDKDAKVMEVPEPKNVYEALNFLMARVGYVQKEQSDELPYSFASETAFVAAIRPHMVDLGLTIQQIEVEHLKTEIYQTKRGATAFNRVFLFTWQISHAPTETFTTVTSIGEGTDYGDKSCNKAMTVGLKYAMRQTLYMQTGDDPDQFNSEDYLRGNGDEPEYVQRERAERVARGGSKKRVKNQWEGDVLQEVMKLYGKPLELERPHIVNILNHSLFFDQVPYGELTTRQALAYVIAWQETKDTEPEASEEQRATKINGTWQDIETHYLDEAYEYIHDEEWDSGSSYGDL
jgi:hypothetical protein